MLDSCTSEHANEHFHTGVSDSTLEQCIVHTVALGSKISRILRGFGFRWMGSILN